MWQGSPCSRHHCRSSLVSLSLVSCTSLWSPSACMRIEDMRSREPCTSCSIVYIVHIVSKKKGGNQENACAMQHKCAQAKGGGAKQNCFAILFWRNSFLRRACS